MCIEDVDDFIGQRFGEGGHLEVVGWDGERCRSHKKYTVKCLICTEDSELFGDGTFKSTKSNLLDGNLPCGCAKNARWTEGQYLIRVKRVCVRKNIKFIGISGEFKGNKTRAVLSCNIDRHTWEAPFHSLLDKGTGCPECGNRRIGEAKTKPDDVMIEKFIASGKFLEGTTFWRSARVNSKGRKLYWNYTCPICSDDEYVQTGLCSGIFETTRDTLQLGGTACRCSKNYRWTAEQREYQVRQIISEESLPYDFIGFVSKYKNQRTKLRLWCCEHSEEFNTTIHNFIDNSRRCPSCAETGFNISKQASLYILKVESSCDSFTGYGISNVVSDRLRTHRKTFSDNAYTIVDMKLFEGGGKEVLDMENKLKQSFDSRKLDVPSFKRENTHFNSYDNVVDFVREHAKLAWLKEVQIS